MTRVLIVDDEILVRVGLRLAIDWQAHGFEIVGEAGNGKEALEKLMEGNVDILLTDIKMPEFDGIELLEEIKKRKINIKSIVLSCHDEYEYVREALKLGAHDYLLKLSLNPEKLLQMMKELKSELDTSQYSGIQNKEELLQVNWFKLLYQFNQDVWEEQKALGTKVKEDTIVVFAMCIDSYMELDQQGRFKDKSLMNNTVKGIIDSVINDYACGDSFVLGEGRFTAMINPKSEEQSIFNQMACNLQQALNRYMQITISMGISEVHQTPKMLNIAYAQAYKALNRRFFIGKESFCFYSDVSKTEVTEKRILFTMELEKELSLAIELNHFQLIKENLLSFFDKLKASKNFGHEVVYRALEDICFLFLKELKFYDKGFEEIPFLKGKTPQYEARKIEYIDDLRDWMLSFAESFYMVVSKIKESVQHQEIRRALEFIVSNYQQNLTVEKVAQYVNMSKNYFSHLFKKEVGESFTEYLTKYRLEKAKDMLKSTDARVNEIAERVGYENIYYFSNVFKKYFGISPVEYRRGMKA